MVVNLLEEMVATARGRPVILLNPKLEDRPSSNNMMQARVFSLKLHAFLLYLLLDML